MAGFQKAVPFLFLVMLTILAAPRPAWSADIPTVPYVEVFFATQGPLSIFGSPDGSGHPFSQACDQTGQFVDGTLTIILYDDAPPWGAPVPNFPREDIFLTDLTGNLVLCPGGTIADANTDADGVTTWSRPLFVGGSAGPDGVNRMAFWVNGWIPESDGLENLRINSADLDGSLNVNLTDVHLFTLDFHGVYRYASDFRWDGTVNLSDVALLAATLGASCP